jgi:hypothetical protein
VIQCPTGVRNVKRAKFQPTKQGQLKKERERELGVPNSQSVSGAIIIPLTDARRKNS